VGATDSFFETKREWSTLKDFILNYYLEPYLRKIISTRVPTRIADCFAGPGRFEDGSEGSPLIIARNIAKALEHTPHADLKGIFIEKRYADDLRGNVKYLGERGVVLEGDYEERMETFLNRCNSERNYFLYVDPFGAKHLAFEHFTRAQARCTRSLEVLLNLNSTGFLREGCRMLALTREIPDWAKDADYRVDHKNTLEHWDDVTKG